MNVSNPRLSGLKSLNNHNKVILSRGSLALNQAFPTVLNVEG